MKLIHILVVVVFLGISASVALADGVDPIVTTKGCGAKTACDAVVLTPGSTTVTVSETFDSCPGGVCTAADSVINETGAAINSFTMVFDTLGGTLTYSCPNVETPQFFACSPVGDTTNAFTFTGGSNSICSTDSNDVSFGEGGTVIFTPDGDADDNCNFGVTIGLSATTSEGITPGETVTASFSTPEPASGLLLMVGLMAGLASLKSRRSILA